MSASKTIPPFRKPGGRAPDFGKPVVYCAGKIAKNDWRHDLFPIRGEIIVGNADDCLFSHPVEPIISGDMAYGGPFFLCCDHGCAHGETGHGLGAYGVMLNEPRVRSLFGRSLWGTDDADEIDHDPDPDEYLGPGNCCGEHLRTWSRRAVVSACINWISKSDFMFVWVDEEFSTAYGSMTEIGMAMMLGKPVVVGVDCRLPDRFLREMWFPLTCAHLLIPADGPVAAFNVARRYIWRSWMAAHRRLARLDRAAGGAA